MRHFTDTILGLFDLFRLGVITGFRFRGLYWRWRLHTAYGRGYPASKLRMVRDILEYARWMHRTRRGG